MITMISVIMKMIMMLMKVLKLKISMTVNILWMNMRMRKRMEIKIKRFNIITNKIQCHYKNNENNDNYKIKKNFK